MTNQQKLVYSQHCNDLMMKLWEATALINAVETMADTFAEGEASPQAVMSDITLIMRSARRVVISALDDLDNNQFKYQAIEQIV